jgi:hypothetical protein
MASSHQPIWALPVAAVYEALDSSANGLSAIGKVVMGQKEDADQVVVQQSQGDRYSHRSA